MLDKNLPVHTYKHEGMWMDIGRPEDYDAANAEFPARRSELLPMRTPPLFSVTDHDSEVA